MCRLLLLGGVCSFVSPLSLLAATIDWNVNAAGTWNTGANWAGGVAPGTTSGTTNLDVARFSTSLTAARIVTVDANRNIGGITFSNTSSFRYQLNGGNLLLSNGGVIQTAAGNGAHTDLISTSVAIQGDGGAATFSANATSASSLLQISGGVTGVSTGANTTTLTLNGSNTGANLISGIIGNGSGGGKLAVVKSGAGQWQLSGANSYTGGTTLSQGTLRLGNTNAAGGAAGLITINDANTGANNNVLEIAAGVATPIVVANSGTGSTTISYLVGGGTIYGALGTTTWTLNKPTTFTASGFGASLVMNVTLIGNGTLTIGSTDNKRVILNAPAPNDSSSFTGAFIIQNNGVFVPRARALTSTTGNNVTVESGGILRIQFTSTDLAPTSIGGLFGAGTVDSADAAGTLSIGKNNASGNFSGNLMDNSTVLSVIKTGSGTQVFAGTSSYGGTTTVNGGVLKLTGAHSGAGAFTVNNGGTLLIEGNKSGAGGLTVASGGTLGGFGTVAGTTSIQSGGTLSPGDSGSPLTFNNNLTLATGAIYAFSDGDLTSVLGTLTANNSWVLKIGGGFLDGGSIILFDYSTLGTFDLTPVFDLSGMDFSPSGPLSLVNDLVKKQILLLGIQTAIPEPSTLLLAALGMVGITWYARRRRSP